jgi:hypothetical protein
LKLAFDIITPRLQALEQEIEEWKRGESQQTQPLVAFEVATTAGGKKDGNAAADGKVSSAPHRALKKLQFQRSSNLKRAIENSIHVKDSAKKFILAPIKDHIAALRQPSSSSTPAAGK